MLYLSALETLRVEALYKSTTFTCTVLRVTDKEGNVLTDYDKVRDRWKEYIDDLYGKNNKPQEEDMHLETDTEDDVKGPSIIFSEYEAALSEFKMERQKERMRYQHIFPISFPDIYNVFIQTAPCLKIVDDFHFYDNFSKSGPNFIIF